MLSARLLIDSDDSDSSSEDDFLSISLPRIRAAPDRPDIFDTLTDAEFRNRFRFTKAVVLNILELIEEEIAPRGHGNKANSAMNKLLMTLAFYASGSFQILYGDLFRVHRTTAGRLAREVTRALTRHRAQIIKMPSTPEEIRQSMTDFYKFVHPHGIPGVIGLIDGTHIKIISPAGSDIPEVFRNRKGYFSINVQAICDSKLNFIDVVARWPGSQHDSAIFNDSLVKARFQRGDFLNGVLLGDAGYSCGNMILTPLRNPVTETEREYNRVHILTRNAIERAYGVVKRRFPALSLGLQVHLEWVPDIIIACFMLHNLALTAQDTGADFENVSVNDSILETDGITDEPINRDDVIRHFFS